MRRKIKLMIIALSFFSLFVANVSTQQWHSCKSETCPYDSGCRGDLFTTPSKCKIQCWAFGGWREGGAPIYHKAGSAYCGEGDDGKPPIWPEL